jgi:hypothetical protein
VQGRGLELDRPPVVHQDVVPLRGRLGDLGDFACARCWFELTLKERARGEAGAPRAAPARLYERRGSAPTLPTSSGHRARTLAVSTMITRELTRKDMAQAQRARLAA